MKTRKLFCNACQVKFTLFSLREGRGRGHFFCPLCGECADVTSYRDSKHPLHPKHGTRPRWTLEEINRLKDMYTNTNYSYTDMGTILGRSEKSISGQLHRMKQGGII